MRIGRDYGSIEAYRATLEFIDIGSPDCPRLADFYALYESVFALAEEREPLSGFVTALAFNRDNRAQALVGPFFETISVLRDPETEKVLGAASCTILSYPEKQGGAAAFFDASCHVNFLCVDKAVRGIGLGDTLLWHVDHRVRQVAAAATGVPTPRYFVTCEINNQTRMTPAQIETDTAAALIDPAERLRWWTKRNFARLDFPYDQPPLSAQHLPCTYVDCYARIGDGSGPEISFLPAAPLLEHLRRFFLASVGKLAIDMARNAQWQRQKRYLEARAFIPLLGADA